MVQVIVALPGEVLELEASAAITKGQMVEVSGERTIGPAGNDSKKVCGIAKEDIAQYAKGAVCVCKPLVRAQDSGSGITAGDRVAAAASGKIKTFAPTTVTGYWASSSGGSPTVQVTCDGTAGASHAGEKDCLGTAWDTAAANAWCAFFMG